jgi:hypothetical protein
VGLVVVVCNSRKILTSSEGIGPQARPLHSLDAPACLVVLVLAPVFVVASVEPGSLSRFEQGGAGRAKWVGTS